MSASERSGKADSGHEACHGAHHEENACRNEDMRCCCGKLLARRTKDGLAIRCPRCKRLMVISLTDLVVNPDTGWSEIELKENSALTE